MPASPRSLELVRAAADAAADKGGSDLVLLDVSDQLALTDTFLLVSGGTDRQVSAVVDGVQDRLRPMGAKAVRREGEGERRWVLLDFIDVIVHVLHVDEREYYSLERLWKDCPPVEWEHTAAVASPRAAAEHA